MNMDEKRAVQAALTHLEVMATALRQITEQGKVTVPRRQVVAEELVGLSTADGDPVEGVLVRTFDDGATWELCLRVDGRWVTGQRVTGREEHL